MNERYTLTIQRRDARRISEETGGAFLVPPGDLRRDRSEADEFVGRPPRGDARAEREPDGRLRRLAADPVLRVLHGIAQHVPEFGIWPVFPS